MPRTTLPTKLSEPLPPLNWEHVGKLWQGRPWTPETSLPAILAGGWFQENGWHRFLTPEAANFAHGACKVMDILRGTTNGPSA